MARAGAIDLCNRHSDRAASGRCDQCGKPFCHDCVIEHVGAEEEFCSTDCRDQRIGTRPGESVATPEQLLAASDRAFINGWKLWARSLPTLCRSGLLFVFGAQLVIWVADQLTDPSAEPSMREYWSLLIAGFGMALAQVILTQKHTGLIQGSPLAWTTHRFVSWMLTNAMVLGLSFIGSIALILPGVYAGLRLFWADEFAMAHRDNPLQALQASWRLTEGEVGSVFRFQFLVGLSLYLLVIPTMIIVWIVETKFEGLHVPAYLEWFTTPAVLFVFFLGYAALHGPEVIRFYGMRAEQSLWLRESKTLGID